MKTENLKQDEMNSAYWEVCTETSNGTELYNKAIIPIPVTDSETIEKIRNINSSSETAIRGDIERVGGDYNYGHKWRFVPGTIQVGNFEVDNSEGTYCSPNSDIDNWVNNIKKLTVRGKHKPLEEHTIQPHKLPMSSDHIHFLKYDEQQKKFVTEKSVRVQSDADGDFTYNTDYFLGEHYLLVKNIAKNDQYLEVDPVDSLDKFHCYAKLSETRYSSGQSLANLIEGDIFEFIPSEEEIETDQVFGKPQINITKNKYNDSLLLNIVQILYTESVGGSIVEGYSRHYVLNWNNSIQKFEIKGWLNTSGLDALDRDLPGLWRGSYQPVSGGATGPNPSSCNWRERDSYSFEYMLDANDNILVYASFEREYWYHSRSAENNNLGSAFAEHTVYTSKFVKYVYNDSQEGNYIKLAEGKNLFPFPDDDTSGELGGASGPNLACSDGKTFGYWFGTQVDASPRNMKILKMTNTEVVMMLEVTKPWLVTQHRYEKSTAHSSNKQYTKDSEWITPYLIVYNLKEDGTYEYTDTLQATDTMPEWSLSTNARWEPEIFGLTAASTQNSIRLNETDLLIHNKKPIHPGNNIRDFIDDIDYAQDYYSDDSEFKLSDATADITYFIKQNGKYVQQGTELSNLVQTKLAKTTGANETVKADILYEYELFGNFLFVGVVNVEFDNQLVPLALNRYEIFKFEENAWTHTQTLNMAEDVGLQLEKYDPSRTELSTSESSIIKSYKTLYDRILIT